jgi:hypothetical protein
VLGCGDDGTCRRYRPSNISGDIELPATCGGVTLDDATIGTTPCAIEGYPCIGAHRSHHGVTSCVLVVDALEIGPKGARVEGKHPLIVLAEGDVTITGLLDASAAGWTAGPGGFNGGDPPDSTTGINGKGDGGGGHCTCLDNDDCGGGGGGFGTAGASGSQENQGCPESSSPGGPAHGDETLVPLIGGSGGASGHNNNTPVIVGAGGGGGGALQISSQGRIQIDGAISAGGAGGKGGISILLSSAAGGGGGSGGAVLLEAIQLLGEGWVAANGGGGGSGAEADLTGAWGEDGWPDGTAAKGGVAAYQDIGSGGDGAAGATAAQPGTPTSYDGAGGGGGGGLGRIRFNLPGNVIDPALKTSGKRTRGNLTPE